MSEQDKQQDKQKVPEPGCLGMGCLIVVATLMLVPCLPIVGAMEENREEGAPQWGVALLFLAQIVAMAVAYFYFWPHLYRMFFQSGEAGQPSSSSRPLSLQQESRARKADDEFPWEAFAYGYLMHELLDDDSGRETSEGDTTWGGDDYDAGEFGTEDLDGGEEFWFYEDS